MGTKAHYMRVHSELQTNVHIQINITLKVDTCDLISVFYIFYIFYEGNCRRYYFNIPHIALCLRIIILYLHIRLTNFLFYAVTSRRTHYTAQLYLDWTKV